MLAASDAPATTNPPDPRPLTLFEFFLLKYRVGAKVLQDKSSCNLDDQIFLGLSEHSLAEKSQAMFTSGFHKHVPEKLLII